MINGSIYYIISGCITVFVKVQICSRYISVSTYLGIHILLSAFLALYIFFHLKATTNATHTVHLS